MTPTKLSLCELSVRLKEAWPMIWSTGKPASCWTQVDWSPEGPGPGSVRDTGLVSNRQLPVRPHNEHQSSTEIWFRGISSWWEKLPISFQTHHKAKTRPLFFLCSERDHFRIPSSLSAPHYSIRIKLKSLLYQNKFNRIGWTFTGCLQNCSYCVTLACTLSITQMYYCNQF